MKNKLSIINNFKKDGFVIIRGLFSKNLCNESLKKIKKIKRFDQQKKRKEIIFYKNKNSKEIKYFKNINFYITEFNIFYSNKLLDVASNLLNTGVYFFNMGYHEKKEKTFFSTPPHQDNFYWCREPSKALTAFIALNKQNYKNGGVGYLPGSHNGKLRQHRKSKVSAFSSYIELENKITKNFVYPNLETGDVVFHHCKTIHNSSSNQSKVLTKKSLAITIYGDKTKTNQNIKRKYMQNVR